MQKKFKNKNYKNGGKKQPTKFVLKNLGIVFDDDTYSLEVLDEIIEVLKDTPFNRITIPLNAYIYALGNDDVNGKPDTRTITVGYIKSFNEETCAFNVVIFDPFKNAIKTFDDYGIEVSFGTYEGKLTKINKLNIVNIVTEDDVELDEVDPDEVPDAEEVESENTAVEAAEEATEPVE